MRTIRTLLLDALDAISDPFPNSTLRAIKDLDDAITLLEQGYHYKTSVDNLINEFGDIHSVPPRRQNRTQEVDLAWDNCYKIEEMINQIKQLLIEDKL